MDDEVRPTYEPLVLEKRNTEFIKALYSISQGVWAVICNIIACVAARRREIGAQIGACATLDQQSVHLDKA